ncbi:HMA2 domain-containing protein [Terasakiella sp.]|uniref:HMA2 domain-containing protein n=1 Tax=Terasakiella sp. TaxID=2034861 RepID=UPI003AA8B82E
MSLSQLTAKTLQENRHFLSTPSHVPGRLRLKCSTKAIKQLDKNLLSNLKKSLEAVPGIKSVRVNLAALSAIIDYDKTTLDPSIWQDFLNGSNQQADYALRRLFGEDALAIE